LVVVSDVYEVGSSAVKSDVASLSAEAKYGGSYCGAGGLTPSACVDFELGGL